MICKFISYIIDNGIECRWDILTGTIECSGKINLIWYTVDRSRSPFTMKFLTKLMEINRDDK